MKRREILALATGAVLLAIAFYPGTGSTGGIMQSGVTHAEGETPPVIINELAWAGSSKPAYGSDDEWIELKNMTSDAIDISGWQLTKLVSSKETLMLTTPANCGIESPCTIIGNGYFVIAKFDAEKSILATDPDVITDSSAFKLVNSNLQIKLYEGSFETGKTPVDVADDGVGTPFAGNQSARTSMERNDIYGPGDVESSWHEATVAINLDAGVIDKGTPKAANSEPAKPAPEVTLISPNHAEIDTILEMESIEGNNFVMAETTTRIELRDGEQMITASDVHVATPMLIDDARFDLHGATAGKWDVVVINPDGQEGSLANALELTEPEEPGEELDYSQNVTINEIYPKPNTGSNSEFIELYNTGDTAVNLKGWQLDDQSPGGSAPYTIEEDCILPSRSYLTFTKAVTHISLNDTGDSARLIQPNGNVISQLTYSTAQSGYSYSWIDNRWQWTLRVTKDSRNILELPEPAAGENSGETVNGEQDSNTENPRGIEIELSADNVGSTSLTLQWQIDALAFINEVKVYQSTEADQLGQLITVANVQKSECSITELKPATKYFFIAKGDYNAYTAVSNQVAVTTKKAAANTDTDSKIGIPTKQVIITELLPNPGGGDSEFIEIYNPTDQPIIISGWKLMDKSKRRYVLNTLDLAPIQTEDEEDSDELLIEPGQYILLDQDITGIHLNNSGGEDIYLLDGDDNIVDSVGYARTARRDYAYAVAPNGKWFWTEEATPGATNEISFAGETEDSGDYLTPSGPPRIWMIVGWLSVLLSAIMWVRIKRDKKIYHQK
jgi:hypothetical protein